MELLLDWFSERNVQRIYLGSDYTGEINASKIKFTDTGELVYACIIV